ncbi:unnamed protein product [Symbiodinium sp. CCMP2456]|nr:unnamed protein product [Symbiodinium sp. CCMP2456]
MSGVAKEDGPAEQPGSSKPDHDVLAKLLGLRQANADMTMKELADACGLSKERAKRLLAKAQTVDVGFQTGSATLGAEFHRCLVDLLEQSKLQEVLHGVLTMVSFKDSERIRSFAETSPHRVPPMPEPAESLYPLGSCKLMSTFVGILGSQFTAEDKFAQRTFSSSSLDPTLTLPRTPNAMESILLKEVQAAMELIKQPPGRLGVTLTVSVTDVHAQENPKEASVPRHRAHFAHTFNLVLTSGSKDDQVEARLYSAWIESDLRAWLKAKNKPQFLLSDVMEFVHKINQVETASIWTKEINEVWNSLFNINLPVLVKRRWPVRTHVRVLSATFDQDELQRSAGLFRAANWHSSGMFGYM